MRSNEEEEKVAVSAAGKITIASVAWELYPGFQA
jgi:hypothetical protein